MKLLLRFLVSFLFMISAYGSDIIIGTPGSSGTATINGFKLEIRFFTAYSGKPAPHFTFHGKKAGVGTVVYIIEAGNRDVKYNDSYAILDHITKNASTGKFFNLRLICNSLPSITQGSGAPSSSQSLSIYLHDDGRGGCYFQWTREFSGTDTIYPQ